VAKGAGFFRASPVNPGQVSNIIHQIGDLYEGCCHHEPRNVADDNEELPAALEDLLQNLHSGAIKAGMIDTATALDTARKLMEAVFEGYGQNFDTVLFDSPDLEMLINLEKNVYQFSAAKNYQMLKDLTLSLKDGDKLRSFAEFRREASQKLDTWVGSWLETEYNTAVGSAQMAARWTEYQQYAGAIPNGTYRTAGDERVSAEHRLLDGITKPLSDPFWNIYWPPLRFNCRCLVDQTSLAVTDTTEKPLPEVPEMFRVNLAKEGLVFPPGHPYYDGVPKKLLNKIKPDA